MYKEEFSEVCKKIFNEFIEENTIDDSIDGLYNISNYCLSTINSLYFKNNNLEESIKLSKILILLAKISNINLAEYYNNLIVALNKNKKYQEALNYCNKVIDELGLCTFDLFYNKAIILKNLQKYEEAVLAFRKAEELNPDFPMLHYQLVTVLFPLKRYSEAFTENEWRFKANSSLIRFRNRFKIPDWDGSSGKNILVFSEHGLGDAIQNLRYIPKLLKISKSIGFEVQEELIELFKNNMTDSEIFKKPLEYEDFSSSGYDCVVSLNSLPYWFDKNYELEMNDAYLNADNSVCQFDFSSYQDLFKVGIVWAGSPWNTKDYQRSCHLKYFESLVNNEKIKCFSLQNGDMIRSWYKDEIMWEGKENYEIVNLVEGCENFGGKIVDLLPFINNLNDSALLIDKLDLIITVDTVIAHLAGAMGKKVWLLLSYEYDWRWMKKIYKNIKFFKQPKLGNWKDLFNQVNEELEKELSYGNKKTN